MCVFIHNDHVRQVMSFRYYATIATSASGSYWKFAGSIRQALYCIDGKRVVGNVWHVLITSWKRTTKLQYQHYKIAVSAFLLDAVHDGTV